MSERELLLTVTIAAVLAVLALREAILGWRALSWPKVDGVIAGADVERRARTDAQMLDDGTVGWSSTTHEARVKYRYEVEGVVYAGDRLRFGLVRVGRDRSAAKDDVRGYHKDATVSVSYDPRRPAVSVLEPGPDTVALVVGLATAVGAAVVLVWLVA